MYRHTVIRGISPVEVPFYELNSAGYMHAAFSQPGILIFAAGKHQNNRGGSWMENLQGSYSVSGGGIITALWANAAAFFHLLKSDLSL